MSLKNDCRIGRDGDRRPTCRHRQSHQSITAGADTGFDSSSQRALSFVPVPTSRARPTRRQRLPRSPGDSQRRCLDERRSRTIGSSRHTGQRQSMPGLTFGGDAEVP